MPRNRLFIDTHDRTKGSFPEGLTAEQLEGFLAHFADICAEEGVTVVQVHAGLADGRAFCLTSAPDAEAVRRAHERAGLAFDSITEVTTASPDNTFFRHRQAA